MTYRPLDPWLFRFEDERPILLGSWCGSCREYFFPRRRLCPICLQDATAVELHGMGTLYSYTYVQGRAAAWGKIHADGYGVGEVDLTDGPRIQSVLTGEPNKWEIGAPMQIDFEVVKESEGDQVVMYCFRPEGETARA
jgi:uncharacterized OB-fold protein